MDAARHALEKMADGGEVDSHRQTAVDSSQ
jgi:hypothetical protein